MFTHKLKLNPSKTEFILIGSKTNSKQFLWHFPINILGNQVSTAQSVKILGVVFDSNSFRLCFFKVIKSTIESMLETSIEFAPFSTLKHQTSRKCFCQQAIGLLQFPVCSAH